MSDFDDMVQEHDRMMANWKKEPTMDLFQFVDFAKSLIDHFPSIKCVRYWPDFEDGDQVFLILHNYNQKLIQQLADGFAEFVDSELHEMCVWIAPEFELIFRTANAKNYSIAMLEHVYGFDDLDFYGKGMIKWKSENS